MEPKPHNNSPITWAQITSFLPLISSMVLIISTFFALQTRLALIEQKVTDLSKQQEQFLALFKEIQTNDKAQDLIINSHEVKLTNR